MINARVVRVATALTTSPTDFAGALNGANRGNGREPLLGHDDDRATERATPTRRARGSGWWSPDRPVPTYSLDRCQ